MPESTQILQFKLVIDGKEAIASIELTEQEVKKLQKTTQQLQERPILKQFAKDLLNIEASSEDAVSGISDFIKYNQVTEKEIQQIINTLREEKDVLAVGSKQWLAHGRAIANLTGAYQKTIMTGQQFTQQSGSMRMAVSQLGFALGDASMITVDFRMFLLSIGNNIPFIVEGLSKVAAEAKASGQSLFQFIKGGMDMSMKLVLGANAVMFAMMVLPPIIKSISSAFSEENDKIKELTDTMGEQEKKIRQQQLEFNALIGILNDTTIAEQTRNEALNQLREKYPEYITYLKSEKDNTEGIAEALRIGNEQFEKKIQLAASERILKEYYTEATELEFKIQKLEEDRARIQKQFDEGNKARGFSLNAIDNDIKSLEEKKANAINKINEFNIKLNEMRGKITSENILKDSIAERKKILEARIKGYEAAWDKLNETDIKGQNRLKEKIKEAKDELKKLENIDVGGGKGDKVTNIAARYELQKKLNELEGRSNIDNIIATQKLVEEELKHNLTLEKKVKLKTLLKELQDDLTAGLDMFAESQDDMDAAFIENQNSMIEKEKEHQQFLEQQVEVRKNLAKLEADEKINSITNQFERERQLAKNERDKDIAFYQDKLNKELITKEEFERAKYLTEEEYNRKSHQLDVESLLFKLSMYQQIANAWQDALNTAYTAAEQSAKNEITLWKDKEHKKLGEERKAALSHARTRAQRERINEQYDKREEQLDEKAKQKAREKLIVWFRLKQLGDIGAATMSTYKAADSALEPPPIGLGPVFGWPLMAAVIAGGLANVAMIANQKIPGFDKGGKLEPGKPGVFEGRQVEIVAPEKTFIQIMRDEIIPQVTFPYKKALTEEINRTQNFLTEERNVVTNTENVNRSVSSIERTQLITMQMMEINKQISSGAAAAFNQPSMDDLRAVKDELKGLRDDFKNGGIEARAYLDDRQAKKIYSKGNAMTRRSKI